MKNVLIALIALSIWGCKKADSDTSYSVDATAESGQQVGDAMAAIDESGGNTNGSIANIEMRSTERAFARLAPNEISYHKAAFQRLVPTASAAACNQSSFSTCSAGQRERVLDGCSTFAGGTMSGKISLNFSGTGVGSCTIPSANDSVSRVPNYSITGLRGATFSVSATSTGQSLKRTAATTFEFSNSGIRRNFVTPKGSTILDITTSTALPIQVTGNSRTSRTLNGGSLTILNNLTAVSCTLTPSSVSWSSGCNCPTAGQWSGSCSDASSFSVAFSGTCGQATVTKGSDANQVIMDRCQ